MKRWFNILMMVLLLTACRSGNEFDGELDNNCYLTIYVYSPGNPIPTRAGTNYKDATADENTIHSLQIWVFKHGDGELVGYLEKENVDLTTQGATFRMLVERQFADYPENVDVYAVANVKTANTGNTFQRLTTRAELDAAVLQGDYFGVRDGHRIEAVPSDGLPMSAVLKDQPIFGSYPALRIGTETAIATLKLTRAVAKLRFVFCRGPKTDEQSNGADVPSHILTAITSLQLHGAQISAQSYLMLNAPFDESLNPANPLSESRIRIEPNLYDDTPLNFVYPAGEGYEARSINPADIPFCYADDDVNKETPIRPSVIWPYSEWVLRQTEANRTRLAYSEAIDQAVEEWQEWKDGGGTGTPVGLYPLGGYTYLRESDKKITGRITYRTQMDEDRALPDDRLATFELNLAGDFSRNHVWTILVMFEGGKMRFFQVVDIGVASWKDGLNEPHDVYNW